MKTIMPWSTSNEALWGERVSTFDQGLFRVLYLIIYKQFASGALCLGLRAVK